MLQLLLVQLSTILILNLLEQRLLAQELSRLLPFSLPLALLHHSLLVPLLQPQLHFQPPLFFLFLQLFVAESVDSAPLVLLHCFQRRCLLQPPLQPLPPLLILPPYFLQLFILKLLQSLGRLDLHWLQYLDAAGLLAILQGPVRPESPPLGELRRVLRHLDAARDLHSLEPKELILFVFDEIGQLIEGLNTLE